MLHNLSKQSLKIAKITIPRGFHQKYIPKWDATCDKLTNDHDKAQIVEEKQLSANNLIDHLNASRSCRQLKALI